MSPAGQIQVEFGWIQRGPWNNPFQLVKKNIYFKRKHFFLYVIFINKSKNRSTSRWSGQPKIPRPEPIKPDPVRVGQGPYPFLYHTMK